MSDDNARIFQHFAYTDEGGERRVQSAGWDDLPAPELGAMSELSPVMILSELAAQNRNVEFTPCGDGTISVAVDNCIVADGRPDSQEVWEVLAREAGY